MTGVSGQENVLFLFFRPELLELAAVQAPVRRAQPKKIERTAEGLSLPPPRLSD